MIRFLTAVVVIVRRKTHRNDSGATARENRYGRFPRSKVQSRQKHGAELQRCDTGYEIENRRRAAWVCRSGTHSSLYRCVSVEVPLNLMRDHGYNRDVDHEAAVSTQNFSTFAALMTREGDSQNRLAVYRKPPLPRQSRPPDRAELAASGETPRAAIALLSRRRLLSCPTNNLPRCYW
jgi:hypothetical protein